MPAQAVSNANLTNYRDDNGTTGFTPKVTFAYDAAAKDIDVRDQSTFPAGVYLKRVHVKVHDKFGGTVHGTINEEPGSGVNDEITMNLVTLDASRGLDITATVIATDGKLIADGSAINIGVAGELGAWDKQKNA